MWNELTTKLPAAGAAGAAAGATTATLAKLFGLGLALGAATATGFTALRHFTHESAAPAYSTIAPAPFVAADTPSPRREVAALSVEAPLASAPAATVRGSAGAAESAAAVEAPAPVAARASVAAYPAEAPDAAPERAAPENAVLVESRRVARVRSLLRGGQPAPALAELVELDRSVPGGVLVQEREALRIEALLGVGERARARDEAQRFLARYPGSPHAKGVERALR
jgi:hypothetical protein